MKTAALAAVGGTLSISIPAPARQDPQHDAEPTLAESLPVRPRNSRVYTLHAARAVRSRPLRERP